jgi:hypothetical protein
MPRCGVRDRGGTKRGTNLAGPAFGKSASVKAGERAIQDRPLLLFTKLKSKNNPTTKIGRFYKAEIAVRKILTAVVM